MKNDMEEKNIIYKSKWHPLFWFGAAAVTIRPKIYIRKDIKESWDEISLRGLKIHEQIHLQQQKEISFWFLKYIFNSSFRLQQELEAYRAQKEYLATKGRIFSKKTIAESLSSKTYFWMISYKKAMEKMKGWPE